MIVRTTMKDVVGAKLASEPAEVADGKVRILGLSPFASLPAKSRDALLDLGQVESLPRRHRLADQGEPVRQLVLRGTGRVKLERVINGRALLLGYRGPGETVGECALGTAVASEYAIVADETEGLALPLLGLR